MEKLPAIPDAFNQLLRKERIEKDDVLALPQEQQAEFEQFLNRLLITLKGEERDALLMKVENIMHNERLWEYNHLLIMDMVSAYLKTDGSIPSTGQIAAETGLSRPTVRKHLKNFKQNELYLEQRAAIDIMANNVMAKVMKTALDGDMRAAKIFLANVNLNEGKSETVVNNQHNYIQINSTVISQQSIQQLKPEQLLQLEQLLKNSLPAKTEEPD